ncbi:MAG: hypothetical protein JETCAE02_16140 [Anaerolineaceae bacterium]|jgi:hypothetical protein|nr:cytochrome C [Anaerolineae bacterium]MBL1172667.1 cytochrome C [Chloroflexota bacterium]MBV6467084.1 Menaquinone reductase, multiheme cytochrome c subunit [Anaerolineales bacterium]MCE7905438.1 cytochrome C [Anaerolineae bacterium CFX3]MDL1925150.1 cytochrome C [Anaerolineae bacterium AMX1]OQY80543.1 MAG: hypothetical protein B6D40_12750 [Anaerolineae bacterium UTCFX3]GER79046.1 conserved hypothetical protein [Candidatus Denitrolinea symbiosum]GJQ39202.1 MAG: hypothetical protein JETCAE02
MIQKVFKWFVSPLGRVALVIIGVGALSAAMWGINYVQRPPAQPIQFPHKRHVDNQIQCLYCHPGAASGPSSGLPTTNKCWGCHQQLAITTTSALLPPLVAAVQNGASLNWVPVAQVPDFVQYNHRPHIAAGLNCENCHGDVASLTLPYENPQVMNMGWCIACHREKSAGNPELEKKLLDCGTCHY